MPNKIDLNDLLLLVKVIEHGGFSAASRAMGIPTSTLSQRVASLERTIGTGLLRRSTRGFTLTEASDQLLPLATALSEISKDIDQAMFPEAEEISGTLRVSTSIALSQYALSPLLPRFMASYPNVKLQIEASNRCVNIVREEFDLTLRAHIAPLKDCSLQQTVVGRIPWCLCASTPWVECNGLPAHPRELADRTTLFFAPSDDSPVWTLRGPTEEITVSIAPRLWSQDLLFLRASALGGGGIAALPRYIVSSELKSGKLVEVLPGWEPPASTATILTPPRQQASKLAKVISDFLTSELPTIVMD